MSKSTGRHDTNQKRTVQPPLSTDNAKQVWVFNSLDRDGHFAFNIERKDMNHKEILAKIISYSSRTRSEIKQETHGSDNKSKNHYLTYTALSDEAKQRVSRLGLIDKIDTMFSMRVNAQTRIVGLRDNEKFIVKWFDPNHEFCLSK